MPVTVMTYGLPSTGWHPRRLLSKTRWSAATHALRATSGRPVLYRGARVGRGGHIFTMVKFRTLAPGAEERIGQYLGEELVRQTAAELTRVGRWLKASQLDELPQLWNVLRGDMSI